MRYLPPATALGLLLAPLTLPADPEADLHAAVAALSRTSYTWQTTVRQRFTGEPGEPRLNLNAPIESEGQVDPAGYSQTIVLRSRDVGVPITVVSRQGDVVARTPAGWLRRTEMRQTAGAEREVEFEGKRVRLSRFFNAALKVSALRTPTEDLLDLLADVKSCRSAEGLILAELRDRSVEKLWGEAKAKSAPEIQGTVIFKLSELGVVEYHVVLAIGTPNSRTRKVTWSMQQWSTRFSAIGATTVAPPEAAIQALDQ